MSDFNKDLYYNLNKIKSYNRFINIIISSRGVGKTYAMKKEVITNFIKRKKQFIYIRRTGTQIKQIKDGDRQGGRFFTDIQQDFPHHDLDFRGDKFYCNDEVMGYAVAITKPAVLRGSSFHDVNIIFFDEFISVGTLDDVYRPNEFNDFMNILDTVIRNRNDVKVYMLGNPYSLVNPYFTNLDLEIKHGERFTTTKDIVIDFYNAEDFAEERKKTAFGRIAKNTAYGTFSLDNQSIIDSEAYIQKRTRNSQFMFNLEYRHVGVSIFYDTKEDLYFCSDMINKDYKGKVVFNEVDIDVDTEYCKHFRDTRKTQLLKLAFDNKVIYYDSQKIKHTMFNVYKRIGIMR